MPGRFLSRVKELETLKEFVRIIRRPATGNVKQRNTWRPLQPLTEPPEIQSQKMQERAEVGRASKGVSDNGSFGGAPVLRAGVLLADLGVVVGEGVSGRAEGGAKGASQIFGVIHLSPERGELVTVAVPQGASPNSGDKQNDGFIP